MNTITNDTYLLTGQQIDSLIGIARRMSSRSRLETDLRIAFILEASKVPAPEPPSPVYEIRFEDPEFDEYRLGSDSLATYIDPAMSTHYLIDGRKTDAEDFVVRYNSEQPPPNPNIQIEYDPEDRLVHVTYANAETGSFEVGATHVTVEA